jgi:hypothetical protein
VRGRHFLLVMGCAITAAIAFIVLVHVARGEWDQVIAFVSAGTFHAIGISQMYRGWKLLDKYGDLLHQEMEEHKELMARLMAVTALHQRLSEYGQAIGEPKPGALEPEGPNPGPFPATPLH